MFNVEKGNSFSITTELPIEDFDWQLGLIVGPSGSGKSTLGRKILGANAYHRVGGWPKDTPIIDAIGPDKDWLEVTQALTSVGLSGVPSWLKPYRVLSTGEKFRAELARIIIDGPPKIVIDEFTSVVDRQVARIGSAAFTKAWRRTGGRAVLLSCHYDIIKWLTPDWIYDLGTKEFKRRRLRRPKITVDIRRTGWEYWPRFEPHHYLTLPNMIAAYCYVGFVDDKPIAHVAVTTRPGLIEARAARLVVMPDWQGVGIGLKFLEAVCMLWRMGDNPYKKPLPTLFNTSHPGLCRALRNRPGWYQTSARLYGENKRRSAESFKRSAELKGTNCRPSGYGGYFRSTQGFRFLGDV